MSVLHSVALDGIGEFVDSGRTLLLGMLPSTAPELTPSTKQSAQMAATLTDRLGFARELLAERFGVTPACGLAGATPEWARTAVELTQKVADAFADAPDAI